MRRLVYVSLKGKIWCESIINLLLKLTEWSGKKNETIWYNVDWLANRAQKISLIFIWPIQLMLPFGLLFDLCCIQCRGPFSYSFRGYRNNRASNWFTPAFGTTYNRTLSKSVSLQSFQSHHFYCSNHSAFDSVINWNRFRPCFGLSCRIKFQA